MIITWQSVGESLTFKAYCYGCLKKRILYTNTDVKADETKGANSQLLNSSSIEVTSMKV